MSDRAPPLPAAEPGAERSPSSHRLVAEVADRAFALRLAGALQDLVDPGPEALTLFEVREPGGKCGSWRIEAYYAAAPDAAALRASLADQLGEPIPPLAPLPVPEANWVALSQAALPPVRAGRFTIYGAHDRHRVPQGPNAIRIEAGEAFGTAQHATTYGCLAAIDQLARSRSFARVLDLGCGSGILAIAAARTWPHAAVCAIDIDRPSVAVATANALANGVGARVRCMAAAGVAAAPVRRRAPFGMIVANILAAPLIELAPALRRVIAPRGIVVLSGMLDREAPAVGAAYRAQGFAVCRHLRRDGWSTLTLVNRTVARAARGA